MKNIYNIVIGIAVALNILYTVYAYNGVNKWRQETDSRIQSTAERVNHIEKQVKNTVERVNHVEDRSISISESVEKANAQIKNEQQIAYKSQDSIVKSMMLLETRVYELEENKLKEQQ
jgi:peptidoglycan hydrolase CwlO-like protein